MKFSILAEAVMRASRSAIIILGLKDYLEIHSYLYHDQPPLDTVKAREHIAFLGRRLFVLTKDHHFEIIDAPPNNVVHLLYWMADLLEVSDKESGNFSHGIAQSLRGRAIVLNHVRKDNENNLEISGDDAKVDDPSAAPKRVRSGIGGAGSTR